jgi:predicted protein tyrosine phosphatase
MAGHPSQGEYRRVLCVCSGGLLRSPTAAWVLSNPPYNYNTRSAGITPKYALVQLEQLHIDWADEIVCMDAEHERILRENFSISDFKKIICLNLSDDFTYRDPVLITEIKERYKEHHYESSI